jgi:ATP adenylyltransferase
VEGIDAMNVLWAPWRMQYILKQDKCEGCIFCFKKANEGLRDRLILFASELALVIMNRYPYNNGHLLVAPVKHCASLDDLSSEELSGVADLMRASVRILKKAMQPTGFNLGLNLGAAAGAGVEDHLHFHVVPRWAGDTNYMTIVGEIRVIPEHLMVTYDKLYPYFKAFRHGGDK